MALDYPIRYCSKCGNIETFLPEFTPVCQYCNSPLYETEYIFIESVEHGNLKPEIRKAIFEKYIKDSPKYSKNAVQNREEQERDDRLHLPSSGTYSGQNKPKCPTCGSTNIKHISTLNRAVSVGVFGLLSGKIGKNYECLNCKARW